MTPEYRYSTISFSEKAKAWIISARPFVIPWILLNTLFGNVLAGFNVPQWLLSCAITLCVLISGHFINNWRDFVKGLDTLENGSSTKAYVDMAPEILPRGMLSLRVVKASAILFLALAFILMYLFVPLQADLLIIFVIGVLMALTYTDIFKPRGFGEIAMFLGYGVSTVCFAYAMVVPLDLTGISGGILIGFWAGILYTIDQWQDVGSDLAKRIHNLAEIIFKANMRISQVWYFALTGSIVLQMGMVVLGWIPASTLLTIFVLPFGHLVGVYLDHNFDKGAIFGILTMWLYILLASLGIILFGTYPPPIYF